MSSTQPPETGNGWDFDIQLGESRVIEPMESEIQIVLMEQVHHQIQEFAAADTGREMGGVLLGTVEEVDDKTRLVISAMLKAKKTTANKTSVTFTHDTWDQIHLEKEILYSDLKIVGWFHTHPGFGVFLSNHDLFIQQNFFNLPWQVAYVVDPVSIQQGFFVWKGKEIVPETYTLVQSEDQLIPDEPVVKTEVRKVPVKEPVVSARRKTARREKSSQTGRRWPLVVMTASLLLLGATNLHRFFPTEQEAPPAQTENHMVQQPSEADTLSDEIAHRLNQLEEENRQMEEIIHQLSGGRFFIYSVQPGDTLWSICEDQYGDPTEYVHVMRVNDLSEPDSLYVGQQLLLYRTGE